MVLSKWALNTIMWIFIRESQSDFWNTPKMGRQYDHSSRDWSDMSSEGMQLCQHPNFGLLVYRTKRE